MKFIIPNYPLPDSFVENVVFTLRKMGHEVLTAEPPVRFVNHRIEHLVGELYSKMAPNTLTPQEKWLLKIYKDFKPDVVLALTQSIREEILHTLQQAGARTVAWWGDTPANMRKQGLLCEGWDLIFIKDKYAVFKMKTLGLNAHFLPEAMNPAWHKWSFREEEINNSILFAGSIYDYRHYLISRLLASGFKDITLFGHRPPKWANEDVKATYTGRYISKEEKSAEFGKSLACINSTAMSEGNSINCRAFEIAGAGGLQIMEYRPAIEDCFDPGVDIVTYSTFGELTESLNRFSKDRAAAMAIRIAAHKRAQQEHTYERRLLHIIEALNTVR